MNSDAIPSDLILEILSRLPAKSVARFRCVSKLWESLLVRPYFKDLFLTKSSAKPRLLFAIEDRGAWSFFSLPQIQNPYEKSSSSPSPLVVTAKYQITFPSEDEWIHHSWDLRVFACGYASSLIYLNPMFGKEMYYDAPVICDPSTGWYAILPSLKRYIIDKSYSFFGFDPIDKQFKILSMAHPQNSDDHGILTLGSGKNKWGEIKCSLKHHKKSEGICINGVLYYLGVTCDIGYDGGHLIVCFDVRSEEFKFIYVEIFCDELINYKGKLGVIYRDNFCFHDNVIELHLWVLEDMEKQEWSKYAYTFNKEQFFGRYVPVVGATASGDIVFSMPTYSSEKPFYVFYFNPVKNILQSVEIQGFGEYFGYTHHVYTFVDYVEDLNVFDMIMEN